MEIKINSEHLADQIRHWARHNNLDFNRAVDHLIRKGLVFDAKVKK